MKKVLAISGGIDSMVMLDILHVKKPIVAHFDHGIRGNSYEDYRFVEKKALEYGLEFVGHRADLGDDCSEEKARVARYDFLLNLCRERNAKLCIAHHSDDVLESIAINLIRGTGWRGLSPMHREDIERPLLKMSKKDIYRYAGEHHICFRQDQTNNSDDYLRNRVRIVLRDMDVEKRQKILELYDCQCSIYDEIDEILKDICSEQPKVLKKVIMQDESCEILRYWLKLNGISLTRPQLRRVFDAIKNYLPGKKCELSGGFKMKISKYYISIIRPENCR